MKKDSIMYDGMTDSSRPGKIYGSRNQSKSNQNRKLVDTFPKSEVSPSGTFSEVNSHGTLKSKVFADKKLSH
ncbi:hypothetical protein RclHR1_00690033 [Rhizophagus clarus]|uniref:Uncharacterized protein n=1 Tax=Rhizophagus clarus TaxID=94130 RepID=A0A2Z6S0C0_9GLOM|nr:hypothetical protein RclHR1_00690033 [Rhizophagus clarus]